MKKARATGPVLLAVRAVTAACTGADEEGVPHRWHLVSLDLAFRCLYNNYESRVPISPDFFAYKADQHGLALGAGFHFSSRVPSWRPWQSVSLAARTTTIVGGTE